MEGTPSEPERRSGAPHDGHLADVLAVIASARSRGGVETLEAFIRKHLAGAEEAEVREAAEVAAEIVESIPVFLARARQEADRRGMRAVVGPLLDRAERYFLQPVDLIPEMTQGMAGLLDDAYLVLRVLETLERGPEPFLDWDLDHPVRFLRCLIGEDVARRLDAIAVDAMRQVSADLARVWERVSRDA